MYRFWDYWKHNILNQKRLAKSEDNLPSSAMTYRSIPFAITVSNLEYFAIQSFMHESSTRHCGLLAIVFSLNNPHFNAKYK
jgi:hypothetical protein